MASPECPGRDCYQQTATSLVALWVVTREQQSPSALKWAGSVTEDVDRHISLKRSFLAVTLDSIQCCR